MIQEKQYLGKYRARVVDNSDPESRGRIKVRVPDVSGDNDSSWALPCVPYAGDGVGFFMIPPTDAQVWVEFEQGDPDYPVWTGCFWGPAEAPGSGDVNKKIIKTDTATITIDDSSESSVTIETEDGLKIVMNGDGIELSNGAQKVSLSSASVSINDGALQVQ